MALRGRRDLSHTVTPTPHRRHARRSPPRRAVAPGGCCQCVGVGGFAAITPRFARLVGQDDRVPEHALSDLSDQWMSVEPGRADE